jgi:hypothetical protein
MTEINDKRCHVHFQLMDNLNSNEEMHTHEAEGCNWVPEYGGWMIEATPSRRKHAFVVLVFH